MDDQRLLLLIIGDLEVTRRNLAAHILELEQRIAQLEEEAKE